MVLLFQINVTSTSITSESQIPAYNTQSAYLSFFPPETNFYSFLKYKICISLSWKTAHFFLLDLLLTFDKNRTEKKCDKLSNMKMQKNTEINSSM